MELNKKTKRKNITNGILALLVLLSIILSFSLWTTGKNIGEEEAEQDQESPSTLSLRTHSIEEVYRPKLIALHGLVNEKPLVITSSYGRNDFLEKAMEEKNFSSVKNVRTITKKEYLEKIQKGSWIEFVYSEELPFGLITSKFSKLTKEKSNLFFDRIIFDQEDPSKVSFYHMDSGSFYTTEKIDSKKINVDSFLNNKKHPFLTAEAIFLENSIKYLPTSSLNLSCQTYIINQIPKRMYINNFFPDTSLVDVRSAGNYTRYIDLTKEVTIDENNYFLNYISQIYTSGEMTLENRYRKSFRQINQYENWSDSIIFSAFDRENNILSYRREIKGIPVFSKNEYESVSEVSVVEEGLTHMKVPLRLIDTPINIKDASKKTLLSGIDIIKNLKDKMTEEEFKLVQDINIGYSWEESDEDDKVVNFEPNWYIFYEDEWVTYSSLVN